MVRSGRNGDAQPWQGNTLAHLPPPLRLAEEAEVGIPGQIQEYSNNLYRGEADPEPLARLEPLAKLQPVPFRVIQPGIITYRCLLSFIDRHTMLSETFQHRIQIIHQPTDLHLAT